LTLPSVTHVQVLSRLLGILYLLSSSIKFLASPVTCYYRYMLGSKKHPNPKKPEMLYHASTNKDIKLFEPRDVSVRTPDEGKLVFATPDQRVAAMFLVPSEIGPSEIGVHGDRAIIVINGTVEKFKAKDKGGAIYVLPSDTFSTDPKLGMGEMEWTSKLPVKPLSKNIYASALRALQEFGAEVYLVDSATFRAIQESEDQGWDIINSLRPYSGK